jgi:hypothetical protein
MTTGWTTPADVIARLRRRWDRGEFLRSWAQDVPFETVRVPIRGPSTAELSTRFDDTRTWVALWAAVNVAGVRVTTRPAGLRSIGANAVPSHIEVDSYDALWRLLGVQASVRRFAGLRTATESELGGLVGFMNRSPMTVLAHAGEWHKLVQTVRWVASTAARRRTYLREVPVAGVDTKLIERRRGILADLIDELLPAEQIDRAYPASQFERRYGFASKPTLVRLRSLDPRRPLLPGVSELTVRAVEFNAVAPDVGTVYIVENEVTYLAFPDAYDAVMLWGSGFAISGFASLPWFCDRRVVYWGDVDTHGFVALDRLRAVVPHARSLLMDRETLLAHAEQWTQEPSPTTVALPHLTDPERELYRELVDGVHGDRIRLEQERVSYPFIETAAEALRNNLGR